MISIMMQIYTKFGNFKSVERKKRQITMYWLVVKEIIT